MNDFAEFCRLFMYPTQGIFIWDYYLRGVVVAVIIGGLIGGALLYVLRKKIKSTHAAWLILSVYATLYALWWVTMFFNCSISITLMTLALLTGFLIDLVIIRNLPFAIKSCCLISFVVIISFLSVVVGFLQGEKFFGQQMQVERQYRYLQFLAANPGPQSPSADSLVAYIDQHQKSPWYSVNRSNFETEQIKRYCRTLAK